MQQPITKITTRGYRRRRLAETILAWHSAKPIKASPPNPIKVVCVSDTHNNQPALPPGEILIHAGDLTENGSFDEVQAGLTWLASQPHPFKILIAGNHDVLLDEGFLQNYPERRYGQSKTKADLDWGDVIYLQDSHITLDVPVPCLGQQPSSSNNNTNNNNTSKPHPTTRKITIYGSPWTPRYTLSAFQYPPATGLDHWPARFATLPSNNNNNNNNNNNINNNNNNNNNTDPKTTEIIVTHGPPKHHLDRRDIHNAGCPYLLCEIAARRPRLHVFGHIHAAAGREDVVLDGVRRAYDEVLVGWGGWGSIVWMGVLVGWGWVVRGVEGVLGLGREVRGGQRTTTFVNASVVGGRGNEVRNGAVVVEI